MNKELQAQVATILQQFSDGMNTVGNVAMKQLPDIAQQYIVYGFWRGLLASVILIACVIASIIAIKETFKAYNRTENEEYFFILIPTVPIVIFGSIGAYLTLQNLLLNISAPKIWLLLEIKSLVS